MADPFRSKAHSQLLREAQIGLTVVAVLLGILVYVAFYRITGRGREIPEHVRNAPVAETVWPNAIPPLVASQGIATDLGQNSALKNKPAAKAIDPRHREAIGNHRVPSSTPNRVTSSQKTESNPTLFGSRKANGQVENSAIARLVQTQTSDPSKVLNKSARTPFSTRQSWNDPIKKSIDSAAKQTPKTDHEIRLPGTHSPVIEEPMTEEVLKNSTRSNHVAPTGFDNELRASIPRFPDQPGSTLITQSQTQANAFPMQPVPGFPAESRDIQNMATKTDVASDKASDPLTSFASEFGPVISKPIDSPSSNGMENHNLNSVRKNESVPFLPSPGSDKVTVPMVSVIDVTGDGQTLNAAIDNTSIDEPQEDLRSRPLQPTLIPAKPIPFTNEIGSMKRLRHAGGLASLAGTTEPVSSVATPSAFSEEATSVSRLYNAKPGDSYWSIAEKIYGDGWFFRALYKYNEPAFPNFDSIPTGASLGTPSREDLIKLFPNDCPRVELKDVASEADSNSDSAGQVYWTREGDTLFEIARQKLGQASRYLEIKEMNRLRLDSQVNHLTPLRQGVRLALPIESLK